MIHKTISTFKEMKTSPATLRLQTLDVVAQSNSMHIGTCLSMIEILYSLYFHVLRIDSDNPLHPERDRFLLSKAHGSAALYVTLAERGFFSKEKLNSYNQDGSSLPVHTSIQSVPGVEISAGSLGHALSIGVGMGLANRLDHNSGRIFVLLGDGELNEGSIWEAAMLASTLKLKNLTAIVDFNKIQGLGRTNEIIDQTQLAERWAAFGFEVHEVDGHDVSALIHAFEASQNAPKVIIAHTVKSKGISFLENTLESHYKKWTPQEYKRAREELSRSL